MSVTLLIILAVCFVIQNLLLYYTSAGSQVRIGPGSVPWLYYYFGLTPFTLTRGWVWQFITFNFLHAPFGAGGFFHILFNCWGIWLFGLGVEEATGPRRLLALFLVSGIAGGLLQAIGQLLIPTHFGLSTVGSSAGVFGLIGAFAALFPTRQLTMLLFFIIPVTITARFLLIFSFVIAVFGIMMPSGGVAHGAHLGGLLAGLAFARWGLRSDWTFPNFNIFRPRPKIFVHKPQSSTWTAAQKQNETELPSEEFISKEVDPILDKISAHGIQSLTERERRILEAARAKMARR
jgi:membrane associated rhomboid family serine protease